MPNPPPPLAALQTWLQHEGHAAAFLTAGVNFSYITGLHLRAMERLTACLIPARGQPALVVPALDAATARGGAIGDVRPWADGTDPYQAVAVVAADLGVTAGSWAVEKRALSLAQAEQLQAVLPGLQWVDAGEPLSRLRAIKSAVELGCITAAADVLAPVLADLRQAIRPGVTEAQLARRIRDQLEAAGADGLSFPPIVLTGARTALPHGEPSAAEVQPGDLVICDFGAVYQGYCSDITRTFVVGDWSTAAARVYDVVQAAHDAALAAVRPGVAAAEADGAARAVIAAAGYGQYFIHRTGHGLGLAVHEPPWIAGDNPEPLAPGMVCTIEPGIYIPGWGGVRLEDMVVVTADGCRSLTAGPLERTFWRISG